MPTLNVRLSDADARLAKGLRARGRSISEVVRTALRAEALREQQEQDVDVGALLAEMKRRFPAPSGPLKRRVDATDRKQVQAAVRRKLRKSR